MLKVFGGGTFRGRPLGQEDFVFISGLICSWIKGELLHEWLRYKSEFSVAHLFCLNSVMPSSMLQCNKKALSNAEEMPAPCF